MAEDPTSRETDPDQPASTTPEPAKSETSVAAEPVEPEPAATTDPVAREAADPSVSPDLPPVVIAEPDIGYTSAGVPTLEGVREKIETRYGAALGATELAEESTEGRTAAQQFDAHQKAAEAKLEEIRASMRKPGQS